MRPGLPLAGFFTHFEPLRLQVIGNAEATYLHSLTPERRAETFDRLFSYHIPALVFARNIEPMPECMQMAEKHDITILRCLESTSYVVSSLITYLKNALAPRITRHGVFVEVYGEACCSWAKRHRQSEAAAELLKRGHRLIADDAVEIRKVAGNTLRGTSPGADPQLYRDPRYRRHQRGKAVRLGCHQRRIHRGPRREHRPGRQ